MDSSKKRAVVPGGMTSAALKYEVSQLEDQLKRAGGVDQRLINVNDAGSSRIGIRVRSRRLDARAAAEEEAERLSPTHHGPGRSQLDEALGEIQQRQLKTSLKTGSIGRRGTINSDAAASLLGSTRRVSVVTRNSRSPVDMVAQATPNHRGSGSSFHLATPIGGLGRGSSNGLLRAPSGHHLTRSGSDMFGGTTSMFEAQQRSKLGYLAMGDRVLTNHLRSLASKSTTLRLSELVTARSELTLLLLSGNDMHDEDAELGPTRLEQLRAAVAYHAAKREREAEASEADARLKAHRDRLAKEGQERQAALERAEAERLQRELEDEARYEAMRSDLRAEVIHEVFGAGMVKPLPKTVIDVSRIDVRPLTFLSGPNVSIDSIVNDPDGVALFERLLERERGYNARAAEERELEALVNLETQRQEQVVARLKAQREPYERRAEEEARLLEATISGLNLSHLLTSSSQSTARDNKPSPLGISHPNPLSEHGCDTPLPLSGRGPSAWLDSERQTPISFALAVDGPRALEVVPGGRTVPRNPELVAARRELDRLNEIQAEAEELRERREAHVREAESRRRVAQGLTNDTPPSLQRRSLAPMSAVGSPVQRSSQRSDDESGRGWPSGWRSPQMPQRVEDDATERSSPTRPSALSKAHLRSPSPTLRGQGTKQHQSSSNLHGSSRHSNSNSLMASSTSPLRRLPSSAAVVAPPPTVQHAEIHELEDRLSRLERRNRLNMYSNATPIHP